MLDQRLLRRADLIGFDAQIAARTRLTQQHETFGGLGIG